MLSVKLKSTVFIVFNLVVAICKHEERPRHTVVTTVAVQDARRWSRFVRHAIATTQ